MDRREIFLQGLAKLLEGRSDFKVVGTCFSVLEAAEKVAKLKPSVILVDIEALECEGVKVIQHIYELLPEIRIIILTHSETIGDLSFALKARARAYISKDITVEALVKAITLVADGEIVISPPVATELLKELTSLERVKEEAEGKGSTDHLSKREREVLTLVAKGATNREIATTLFITRNTVKVHLRNILEKLHVHNRQQAATFFVSS